MKKIICKQFITRAFGGSMLMLLLPLATMAQQGDATGVTGSFTEEELLLGLAIFLAIVLVFATLGLLFGVVALTRVMSGRSIMQAAGSARSAEAPEVHASLWERLKQRLTNAVPVEQEAKVMTDHEYDGIRELDNSLPPWWTALFYATIVFSVVYLAAYHMFGWGELQEQEYQTELAEAQAQIEAYMATKGDLINENTVTLVTDEALLSEGQGIFAANCAACHGAELQGTVGPNLTDAYWLHGGSVGDVFKTIHDGVPAKGMISWKAQLSPEQIQYVASYIISMEGSEPAGAKEPQGELYERK